MGHDDLAHLRKVELADESASPIRRDPDEAFRREPVDRLSRRRSAELKLLEQQCLIDPAARGRVRSMILDRMSSSAASVCEPLLDAPDVSAAIA